MEDGGTTSDLWLSPYNSSLSKARRSSLSPFWIHSRDYGNGRTYKTDGRRVGDLWFFPGYTTHTSFTLPSDNLYFRFLRRIAPGLPGVGNRPCWLTRAACLIVCRCSFWVGVSISCVFSHESQEQLKKKSQKGWKREKRMWRHGRVLRSSTEN